MDQLIHLLSHYKYFILFPLAVVEGPIVAVIAGFLCMRGFLNPWIVLPVIVLGDITGDSICFAFGKWGLPVWLRNILYKYVFDRQRVQKLRVYINSHPSSIVPLSKIALGVGVLGIYLTGNAGVPYKRFIRLCLLTSVGQYIIYLSIGLLFGHAYGLINRYLNYTASLIITIFLVIMVFVFIQSKRKRI